MKNKEKIYELPSHLKPRALEAKITLINPRKDFHHASLKNFLRLKKTDAPDSITSNDYYSFCMNNIVSTCRAPEHDRCWKLGYCVINPLENDYRDFLAGGRFIKKGTYLNRRIQGKTGE